MLNFLPTHVVLYLYILAALLGAVLGSALNCLALRLAAGEKWSGSERSKCPHCGHTLGVLDLIPVVSWLLLRGKCRYCGGKVSARYIAAELTLALCFVLLLHHYGLSLSILTPMILTCCLFCLSLVDLDTQIIPDRFLVIPLAARAVELLFTGGISALVSGLLPGLIIGGGVLALSLIMDKVLKKDTMGGGDIKLLFVLGCYLTLPEMLLMVMVACVVGIVMASILMKLDSETPFPFGPALSLAAFAVLLVGKPIITWYLGLF